MAEKNELEAFLDLTMISQEDSEWKQDYAKLSDETSFQNYMELATIMHKWREKHDFREIIRRFKKEQERWAPIKPIFEATGLGRNYDNQVHMRALEDMLVDSIRFHLKTMPLALAALGSSYRFIDKAAKKGWTKSHDENKKRELAEILKTLQIEAEGSGMDFKNLVREAQQLFTKDKVVLQEAVVRLKETEAQKHLVGVASAIRVYLEENGESKGEEIRKNVKGRNETKDEALEWLVGQGGVRMRQEGSARLYSLAESLAP